MQLSDLRTSFRLFERRWLASYLVVVAILCLLLVAPATRGRILGLVARAVDWTESRWDQRVERGIELLHAGSFEQASDYLEWLDRRYPAPTVRAGKGRQRERILLALARSYEAQGRRGRALEAYQRLADFDPRNYANHYVLGQAHVRLARSWSIPPEADQAFRAALAINPNHLPSVRGVMAHAFERGDFAEVARVFDLYLAAPLMQNLRLEAGDSVALIRAPVDGRDHLVRLELPLPNPRSVLLRVDGFPVRLTGAVLEQPMVSGQRSPAGVRELSVAWNDLDSSGDWHLGSGPRGAVLLVLPDGLGAKAAVAMLRLGKPVDPEVWQMLRASYANLLRPDALDSLARRVAVYPTAAVADSINPYFLD